MFFVVQTAVGMIQTLFSEAETLFFASATLFFVTDNAVGDTPTTFCLPQNQDFSNSEGPRTKNPIPFMSIHTVQEIERLYRLERDREPGKSRNSRYRRCRKCESQQAIPAWERLAGLP